MSFAGYSNTQVKNHRGNWYFKENDNSLKKCEARLSNQLEYAKINSTITYTVGQWSYTTTKNSNGKATQKNNQTGNTRIIVFKKSHQDTIAPNNNNNNNNNKNNSNNNNNNNFNKSNSSLSSKNSSKSDYLDSEKSRIEKLFRNTMSESQWDIIEIKRINFNKNDSNNTQLLMYKQLLESKIKAYNKKNHNKNKAIAKNKIEKTLFHGTKKDVIIKIKNNGFNRDFNTTAYYGKGVYFARDASYSHGYCNQENGEYIMLACNVIIGDYCKGDQSLTTPPFKSDGITQYDSLVNDVNNPSIFVVSRDYHCIPSYLIKYCKNIGQKSAYSYQSQGQGQTSTTSSYNNTNYNSSYYHHQQQQQQQQQNNDGYGCVMM